MREPRVVQRWVCPKCAKEYRSPMRVSEVTCRACKRLMKLEEGEPPRPPRAKVGSKVQEKR